MACGAGARDVGLCAMRGRAHSMKNCLTQVSSATRNSCRRNPSYTYPSLDVNPILHMNTHTHAQFTWLYCIYSIFPKGNCWLNWENIALCFVGNFTKSCSKFQKIISPMVMLLVVFDIPVAACISVCPSYGIFMVYRSIFV